MIKVFIADDQELIRESLKIVLDQNEDMQVIGVAENGQILMDMLQDGQPDVILMDVRMPVMNGYEATRAIRELPQEITYRLPIIAMTADAFEEDVQAARQAGMDRHVSKPIRVPELMGAIDELLSEAANE